MHTIRLSFFVCVFTDFFFFTAKMCLQSFESHFFAAKQTKCQTIATRCCLLFNWSKTKRRPIMSNVTIRYSSDDLPSIIRIWFLQDDNFLASTCELWILLSDQRQDIKYIFDWFPLTFSSLTMITSGLHTDIYELLVQKSDTSVVKKIKNLRNFFSLKRTFTKTKFSTVFVFVCVHCLCGIA